MLDKYDLKVHSSKIWKGSHRKQNLFFLSRYLDRDED